MCIHNPTTLTSTIIKQVSQTEGINPSHDTPQFWNPKKNLTEGHIEKAPYSRSFLQNDSNNNSYTITKNRGHDIFMEVYERNKYCFLVRKVKKQRKTN